MAFRVDWSQWDPWAKLWDEWVRIKKGEKNIIMEHIQFIDLYNFFVRQVKVLGLDPHEVDVKAYVDSDLTYEENKRILAEMMRVPPTTAEYESMYESYKNDLLNEVREKYPEVVADFEKQVQQLERETERLPKVEREKKKYEELAEKLRYQLEETLRHYEEEKAALEKRVAPIKLKIVKSFREGIIDYTLGSVVETRDFDWALSLIQRGLAERVAIEIPVEVKPKPPPPTAPPEEIFKPPPKKPPEVPVKVLPPIPEVCPRDGTPLKEMTRVPMLIKDPLRLEPEEEYWRARMGMPLPTAIVEWIEVPATMRVWMCEQDHYFERDARGKLVELTPEFLYRKILREAARLRRIEGVPGIPEVVPPEVRTRFLEWQKRFMPPGPERKAISLNPRDWLLSRYNMTWGEFLKKDDYERKRLLDEYEKEVREGK